jgi:N-acylethanolamine-hydrolysing acid amidase
VKTIVDLHGWGNSFGPVLEEYLAAFIFMITPEDRQRLSDKFRTSHPDWYAEYLGIMQQLHANGCLLCNDTALTSMVYFYEIAHAWEAQKYLPSSLRRSCCGVLSLPANRNESIIHGRNMDERPHPARNMTLDAVVMRGGKVLYHIIDWTWIIGAATTSRQGALTLEMNWNNDGPYLPLGEIVSRLLLPSTIGVLQLFRKINEEGLDFDDAIHLIATADFAAPFYNIISGTGRRGAVLTIAYNRTNDVVELINDTSPVSYMVQTNYDRWKPDQGKLRRTTAENALKMMGRERSGTELGVWMALSTYPVHNPFTLFTCLMRVDRDPEVYLREAMVPETYG